MKLFKKILFLMLAGCLLPMGMVFAVSGGSVVASNGAMLSGDGSSFETTDVTMPKNGTLTYTVNVDKTSLYRVVLEGTFYAKSIFNISVDSIAYDNVSIYNYAYDRVIFFVELEAGERKLGINMGMASSTIKNIDVKEVSSDNADAFVSEINMAQTAEEIRNIVLAYDDNLSLCATDIEKKIFYPLAAYDRMLGQDYKNINDLTDGLFSALFAEKASPEIKLSENGTQITDLKQGALELNIKNSESGNEIFAAIYDDENRLFSISKFVENPQEILSGEINLSNEENAADFKFKLLSWDSAEKMIPKEKFSGIYKEIYMSENGSDSGDGSEKSPFATLSRVKEEILKYNSDMQGDIVVHIMSGNYFVDEQEVFSEKYSGSNGYNVVLKGEGNSKPVFSGGKEIIGFSHWQNGIYKASFDSENELRELFVDGIPAVRAKSKWLYKYIEDYNDGSSEKKIVVADEDFPTVSHPEEAELVWEMTWVCQRTPVKNIEVIDGKTVITLDNFYQTDGVDSIMVRAGKCFYVENALELLDEPGEFYYSKADKTVYYYPLEGENPNEMEIVAPVTEGLLSIEGKSFTKKVTNLIFENISFKHGTWNQPNSYPLLAVQAGAATNAETQKTDSIPPAQIKVDYADSIRFKDCTFESMGANALAFSEAVTNVDISGNVMKDIGGAAISIGKSTQTEIKVLDYREVCKNFRISNNVIRRTAFHYRQMPAITAYYANGVQIKNNDMKDTAYSGISAGWGWDSAKNINKNSGRFRIEGNKISRVMWSLSDGGHVYTLGHLPDSVIIENHVDSHLSPSFLKDPAIYLDEGSTYINVFDNVVTNCKPRKWLLLNNSDEDMCAEVKGNYADSDVYGNKTTTALGENYTGLTSFPEKAQTIMENAGVGSEYRALLSDVELSDERVKNLYSAPKNEYYEGILVMGTSFYNGSVTDCGENYVSFNLGNYMYYKLDVPKTATYDISAYIGVGGDDESKTVPLSWKIDGLGTTNNVTVPYTGGYGKYEPFTMGCVTLEKGTYTLYIKNNGSGCHVNKFIFTEREELIIPATDFYSGSVTAVGANYVSFNAGNYMYYNVEVPIDGTYDMTAYVGVGGDDTSKVVQFAWQYDASGSIKFANVKYTGGYGKYEPFSLGSVYLTAGKHSLWLKNNTGGCHVQKIVIK